MTDEQKITIGNILREKVPDYTPQQFAEFCYTMTQTQRNALMETWITEKKAIAQAAYDGADGVATSTQADATAKIALYDSILALV